MKILMQVTLAMGFLFFCKFSSARETLINFALERIVKNEQEYAHAFIRFINLSQINPNQVILHIDTLVDDANKSDLETTFTTEGAGSEAESEVEGQGTSLVISCSNEYQALNLMTALHDPQIEEIVALALPSKNISEKMSEIKTFPRILRTPAQVNIKIGKTWTTASPLTKTQSLESFFSWGW